MNVIPKDKSFLSCGAIRVVLTALCIALLCACQNSTPGGSSGSVIQIINNEKQLQSAIESSDNGLTMIDFYAEWCGPCHKLETVLEKLAGENNAKVTIYKLDIDKHKKMAARYEVRKIPFVLFFRHQKPVHEMVGLYPINAYRQNINRFI